MPAAQAIRFRAGGKQHVQLLHGASLRAAHLVFEFIAPNRRVIPARRLRSALPKLGSRIAARFKNTGLTEDLPELHGQPPQSADFGR
jgi:hypothetical protein